MSPGNNVTRLRQKCQQLEEMELEFRPPLLEHKALSLHSCSAPMCHSESADSSYEVLHNFLSQKLIE